jgi:hypothetical protein
MCSRQIGDVAISETFSIVPECRWLSVNNVAADGTGVPSFVFPTPCECQNVRSS